MNKSNRFCFGLTVFETSVVSGKLWEGGFWEPGPVVRISISANPGLNFNPGFFFFRLKAFSKELN